MIHIGLGRIELIIDTAGTDQFVVAAHLGDHTVGDGNDPLGCPDGT